MGTCTCCKCALIIKLNIWSLASSPSGYHRNLGRNRLSSLRADMFTGIPALRTLFMYYNNLTYIPQDVFSSMPEIGRMWVLTLTQCNLVTGSICKDSVSNTILYWWYCIYIANSIEYMCWHDYRMRPRHPFAIKLLFCYLDRNLMLSKHCVGSVLEALSVCSVSPSTYCCHPTTWCAVCAVECSLSTGFRWWRRMPSAALPYKWCEWPLLANTTLCRIAPSALTPCSTGSPVR